MKGSCIDPAQKISIIAIINTNWNRLLCTHGN